MSESNAEIRHFGVLLQKREKCDTSREKNCDVYGPNALSVRVAQNWFKRFQSDNFDVKDEPCSGLSVTDKADAISENVEQDRHISSYDIAEGLWIDHKTVWTHSKKAGCTKKPYTRVYTRAH
ncbi:Histone-lysine N-methyltransferase SETMAR [Eumeta japonica]|uniref:Histone-lysine N-methyltransferase SETMAR n=1 Tax=Eumeta variegata TaxID=151549 RepID=A0A4C1UUW8_EUMVA|nr:Histone-lysine N-methyltransferase SETMAR [Eumeta japonica]